MPSLTLEERNFWITPTVVTEIRRELAEMDDRGDMLRQRRGTLAGYLVVDA